MEEQELVKQIFDEQGNLRRDIILRFKEHESVSNSSELEWPAIPEELS